MTTPRRTTGWPSVPVVLVAWLSEQFPDVWFATRFPSDLQERARNGGGVVRIIRTGGTNRDQVTDQASIAIDVVHGAEGLAEDLAEDIRTALTGSTTIWGAGCMLDRVVCDSAPHEAPYTDPSVSQFSMQFSASSRRMETR